MKSNIAIMGSNHQIWWLLFCALKGGKADSPVEIDKVPVLGYTTWVCGDIVSAGTGEMKKRYGFVYVDLDDKGNGSFKRSKKDSFFWYQKVIRSNGEELE